MLKALAIPLIILGSAACGTWGIGESKNEVSLTQSELTPAADAKAQIWRDDNDNARVKLKVDNLAQADNLQPPRQAYAVWAQTQDGQTYLLGRLDVNKDGKGELTSTVPEKTFRLVVTAEDVIQGDRPSNNVVLSSNYVSAPR